jgi:septum formation protein
VLILASASPRRRDLLTAAGVPFVARPVDADEAELPGEDPARYVRRVALAKAAACPGETVLAADTTVVFEGCLWGKPGTAAAAVSTLTALQGREHLVRTAVVLRHRERVRLRTVVTRVRFRPLSPAEIAAYVATGEPLDRAGAYAMQGLGGHIVERIVGSYTNVVGLPLRETLEMLDHVGCGPRR